MGPSRTDTHAFPEQADDTVTNGPLSGDCFSKDQEDSYHGNRHKLNPLTDRVGGYMSFMLYLFPI